MTTILLWLFSLLFNYHPDSYNLTIDVYTTSGLVRGQIINSWLNVPLNVTVRQFRGIPYAEPPVGKLRFAKPQPIATPLRGVIDATKQRASCMQPDKTDISEDCLFINIWTQDIPVNSNDLKPVMFWIHGGALTFGSSYEQTYFGGLLAAHDVVLVSLNYRVGAFGFLYTTDSTTPGNVGFYDQNLALEWVRDNIHLFGGDKNQITLFGQSAGSWSVGAHLVSPESNGMFSRAIMESAALVFDKELPKITKDVAIESAHTLGKHVNCSGNDEQLIKCMRMVSAEDLLAANAYTYDTGVRITWPVVGTEFLPITPQEAFEKNKFNKVKDLMAGTTKDDGSIFVNQVANGVIHDNMTEQDFIDFYKIGAKTYPGIIGMDLVGQYLNSSNKNDKDAIKWAMYDSFSHVTLTCPTYFFAKGYSNANNNKTNVFFYELTHSALGEKVEELLGIPHTAELAFVFGTPFFNPSATQEDRQFSRVVMKYWTDFAKYGKPDTNWPQMLNHHGTYVKNLNPDQSVKQSRFYEVCESFWKNYFF